MYISAKLLTSVVIVTLIVLGVAAYLGYRIGQKPAVVSTISNKLPGSSEVKTEASPIGPSTLITKQQALATGTVTNVTPDAISIEGSDGAKGTFQFNQNLIIYPLASAAGQLIQGTKDKKAIVTGKKVNLLLELINQVYQVTNITYVK